MNITPSSGMFGHPHSVQHAHPYVHPNHDSASHLLGAHVTADMHAPLHGHAPCSSTAFGNSGDAHCSSGHDLFFGSISAGDGIDDGDANDGLPLDEASSGASTDPALYDPAY
jgi:hypothetical protein